MVKLLGACLAGAIRFAAQALADRTSYRLLSMPVKGLLPRDTVDFDADGLNFLKKMAAVGDSYSAGIGSGSPLERSYHGKYQSGPIHVQLLQQLGQLITNHCRNRMELSEI